MNYDKLISHYLMLDGWHYNKEHKTKYNSKKKKLINIKNYIDNRYIDSKSFKETIYRMYYNIEKRPTCEMCGAEVDFVGKGNIIFHKFCSKKCANKCPDTISKKQESDRLKHNGHLGWNINTETKINKRLQTIKERYGSMKYFTTKIQQTFINKYGENTPFIDINVVKKRNQTYKINNSFNKSLPEEESYKLLCDKFTKNDVKRQYVSELYPWACDFYIISLDLYIECHYSQYHQKHAYNYNSTEDQQLLYTLQHKSEIIKAKYHKTITQYDKMIYTWTDLDVRKLNTFKMNNLNYKIFYNINDLKEWIKKGDS